MSFFFLSGVIPWHEVDGAAAHTHEQARDVHVSVPGDARHGQRVG